MLYKDYIDLNQENLWTNNDKNWMKGIKTVVLKEWIHKNIDVHIHQNSNVKS